MHEPRWSRSVRRLGALELDEGREGAFTSVIQLLAKMVIADGKSEQRELVFVQEFLSDTMKFSSPQQQAAMAKFRLARGSTVTFEEYAERFYGAFQHSPRILKKMLHVLMSVSQAEGRLGSEEQRLIREATRIFKLEHKNVEELNKRHRHYEKLRRREQAAQNEYRDAEDSYYGKRMGGSYRTYQQNSHNNQGQEAEQDSSSSEVLLTHAYSILGCSPNAKDSIVKKRYRKLVLKYHPDRLRHKDISEKKRKRSVERFRSVQDAYDLVMEARSSKVH